MFEKDLVVLFYNLKGCACTKRQGEVRVYLSFYPSIYIYVYIYLYVYLCIYLSIYLR